MKTSKTKSNSEEVLITIPKPTKEEFKKYRQNKKRFWESKETRPKKTPRPKLSKGIPRKNQMTFEFIKE